MESFGGKDVHTNVQISEVPGSNLGPIGYEAEILPTTSTHTVLLNVLKWHITKLIFHSKWCFNHKNEELWQNRKKKQKNNKKQTKIWKGKENNKNEKRF